MSQENPIYHSDTLTYGSYLKVPELLGLQKPKTTHHDEVLFIIAHQVYELWFKQITHELLGADGRGGFCGRLDADEPLRAAHMMERVHAVMHLLIEQIPVLETMFSSEFAKFRDSLRPASGFQSVQFRKLEFLCGNKNPAMLKLIGPQDGPTAERERAEMMVFLNRPTPYDHFVRHLSREDNGVFKIPREALERDTSKPHETDERLVDALEVMYRKQEEFGSKDGERYYAQVKVAESLLQFDEKFQIWRFHHVKMVERMIGSVAGTGGSSGAKYLASTLHKPFFPDLWAVRARFGGGYGGSGTVAADSTPVAGGGGGGGGCPMGR